MHRVGWDISVNVKIARRSGDDADASSVAAMFALTGRRDETLYEDFHLVVEPGEIIAVVGPSGGGKTSLLRAVAKAVPDAITLDPDALATDSRPAIACLKKGRKKAISGRLAILSRCGLAEVTALITPAKHLSGGQLYRLALAKAIWQAVRSRRARLVLIDEFAATLDDATAAVLAAGLRKLARRYNLALLVSTPRQELLKIINPDRTIVKPLGEPAITNFQLPISNFQLKESSTSARADWKWEIGNGKLEIKNWQIERGNIRDYRALGRFHYLTGPPAAHKRVWTIRVPDKCRRPGLPVVAAVLVVSPPVLQCRGRNVATGGRYVGPDRRASTGLLNAEIECISRVIVHPIYRGCGLAVRLVRHALHAATAPLVEALATMGAIHPFFELGGMNAFGRFPGRSLNYNYYLAANAVLPRKSFKTRLSKGESL